MSYGAIELGQLNIQKGKYDVAFDILYDVFPAFEMQRVSKRAAFVVDAAGNIQYAETCATPGDLPDFGAIQATLASV